MEKNVVVFTDNIFALSQGNVIRNLNDIVLLKKMTDSTSLPWGIRVLWSKDGESFWYSSEPKRDKDFETLEKKIKELKKGGFKMLDSMKEYLKKHEETIITVLVIVLIDQFIFNGAFRDKLGKIFDSMINSVSKKVEGA